MNRLKLYIDADPMIYKCGWATQKSSYSVIYEDDKGGVHQKDWENGTEKNNYFKEHDKYTVLELEKNTHLEPVENALSSFKVMLRKIHQEVAQHYKVDVMDIDSELYLTGEGNFRYEIAKQRPYKEGRPPKPEHYQALRDYAVNVHNAIVVAGVEADDVCSIQARETGGVVATIDKDLDQIPGHHYNYDKKVFYEISEYDAMLFFYQQCISGDATDAIPGCWMIGATGAHAWIQNAAKDIEKHYMFTWQEDPEGYEKKLWSSVLAAYTTTLDKTFRGKRCPYTQKDIPKVALETARLVKMQEYDGQLWTPPGEEDEVLNYE